MDTQEKKKLLEQIMWDYNIPPDEVEAVLNGDAPFAGHYSREMLFRKILESYSWFTVMQLIPPEEIKKLLDTGIIKKLRATSLQKQYEFIRQRLQEVIPLAV
jgi:hypothetical protein